MKNRNVLLTVAVFLGMISGLTAQNVPSYVPTNGLVGWWPFNGNANDESGNGNIGTGNGTTLTIDRFGATNSAFNFNGINNYITIPNNTNFPSQNFTFSIWFKAVYNGNLNYNSGLGRYICQKGGFPCPVRAALNAAPNSPASYIGNNVITVNGTGGLGSNFNDPNYLWHHYVISYNGFTQIDYLDGVVIGSSALTGALITNLGELTIGCRINQGYQDFFLGNIDDFGIWNRALSQQEITALYQGDNTTANCIELPSNLQQGLVGYWPFCGNANDESGNGNNGTVNGATLTEDRFGNSGNAYSFDGVNDNIEIPYDSSINPQRPFSVSFFGLTNSPTISQTWVSTNPYGIFKG